MTLFACLHRNHVKSLSQRNEKHVLWNVKCTIRDFNSQILLLELMDGAYWYFEPFTLLQKNSNNLRYWVMTVVLSSYGIIVIYVINSNYHWKSPNLTDYAFKISMADLPLAKSGTSQSTLTFWRDLWLLLNGEFWLCNHSYSRTRNEDLWIH